MFIKSLHIEGFRSIKNLTLDFDLKLTTLVGENNTGKSAIGIALNKLFSLLATENKDHILKEDYPYGKSGPIVLKTTLALSPSEIEDQLVSKIVADRRLQDKQAALRGWLLGQGSDIEMMYTQNVGDPTFEVRWGELYFYGTTMSGIPDPKQSISEFLPIAEQIALSQPRGTAIRQVLHHRYNLGFNVVPDLAVFARNKYKLVQEFRSRALTGKHSKALESLSGEDTASVLLNLKNHPDPSQKARYSRVVDKFTQFFPSYKIDAVYKELDNRFPDVQFYELDRTEPLPLDVVSAGVHQLLTIITNLVAREGMTMFLEHPETHLHPHSMRSLLILLHESAQSNQIIIVTHDPCFVDPKAAQGLRRVWWSSNTGTKLIQPETTKEEKRISQMETALRHLGCREIVFARAVILVEDESMLEFITAVAPTLGFDIDSNGISIISTDGHDGFQPFHTLLQSLGIPHVNLRDKPWRDSQNYPSDRFFDLGIELEQYLDAQGLSDLRSQVAREVGNSKRRQAAALGRKLSQSQVPAVFKTVLETAIHLAKSGPEILTKLPKAES